MITIKNSLLNFVRPSEHSTFSPSASDRWIACPASIKLTEGIPNESSKYADEGTFAHSVCEHIFRESYLGLPIEAGITMGLAQQPDGGAEMIDCANQFVDVVTAWLKFEDEIGEVIWWGQEKGIPIFAEEGCFGTADFIIIGTKGAVIIDFKFGKGKEVKKGSTQLKTYCLGIMRCLENLPEDYKFNAVVHQPRITVVPKVDEYSISDLETFEDIVFKAIQASKVSGEPIGGNHCFWCPANRTKDPALKCPAIKAKVVEAANQNFAEFFNSMNQVRSTDMVDPEKEKKRDAAMIKIMGLAPLLSKMAEDARSELAHRIAQGEIIPGVMMQEEEGRRRWADSDVEGMAMRIQSQYPSIKDATRVVKSLKTITEIEKIVGKNKLDGLTVKPVTKKLVVLDEKVQEILSSFAQFQETAALE
jgi:hypothetical protein